MRTLLLAALGLVVFTSQAQRKIIIGEVRDEAGAIIPNVHIRNLTVGKITVSNHEGRFHVPAFKGDSLLLTSIGFKDLVAIAQEDWFDQDIQLTMQEEAMELDELTVTNIPSIDVFKERIMEFQPKDSAEFWYFGVDQPVIKGDKMVQTKKYKSPLFALLHPASFIYYNASKSEKEKRKFYKLSTTQPVAERAYKKFSRQWVQNETGLEGDELTSFIAFCDFDIFYLDRTPLFMIHEKMMAKLEEFNSRGKG